MLGFTMIFNYFARVQAHQNKPGCVITFNKRVLMPWERDGNPLLLRIGAMLVRPLSYHKLMDRINMLTLAQQTYTKSLLASAQMHYPQLKAFELLLEARDVCNLKVKDIKQLL